MNAENSLADLACEACRADAPKIEGQALQEQLKRLPAWSLVEIDGVKRLERVYTFPDFSAALDFTVKIGELAEDANHHPQILTEWGKVTVHWWTHKIKGLHRNDFILAARCDGVY
ncbi:4a-hydroxytetrahydrobiopterin dehydratase [Marinospirillum celere]|uniref:Putative pterin-4-alpha-carbinolamine dehydratase n=1 Tax=Marinospirillum celere TaxID=1122252 RepID=A0A1I1GLS8_9GAMM|nr:4a-hydroxytetrahydrobiopterin dehydratase [Marinospirillum celere]SFC12727.1 4a-hydroxytetrahydrobiopterin dehydratase [Marinospirillum celere]